MLLVGRTSTTTAAAAVLLEDLCDQFAAAADPGLVEHGFEVLLHGKVRNRQRRGNRSRIQAAYYQLCHLGLSMRKAISLKQARVNLGSSGELARLHWFLGKFLRSKLGR